MTVNTATNRAEVTPRNEGISRRGFMQLLGGAGLATFAGLKLSGCADATTPEKTADTVQGSTRENMHTTLAGTQESATETSVATQETVETAEDLFANLETQVTGDVMRIASPRSADLTFVWKDGFEGSPVQYDYNGNPIDATVKVQLKAGLGNMVKVPQGASVVEMFETTSGASQEFSVL